MPLRFSSRVLLLLAGLPCVLWAQTTPDAGALRQQLEQQREAPLPQVSPNPAASTKPAAPAGGTAVLVRAFALKGNTLLSDVQLQAALAGFRGQSMDLAGLRAANDAVAAAYREAGWMARVYLPEQDVSTGVITLQVLESQFAGMRLEGQAPQRVMPAEVEAYFTAVQATGQPLNATALDRALMLSDDLPGVSVAGTLVAGQNDGETELVLRTTDEPLWFGNLALDNTGSRATGTERLVLSLGMNSPGRRGELASLNLMHTQGSDYASAALTVPVGHNGLRAGISASEMTYRVVEGPGAQGPEPVRGNSSSLGVDLNYPMVRSRMYNLYLSAAINGKDFRNQDTLLRSDYSTQVATLGLSGNRFDNWGGGGANSASLQWSAGQLSDVVAHSQIDTLERRFHKLAYSLTRQQSINSQHSVLLSFAGQYSGASLDSSEKFYIGGAQSVRAYPVSELSGDRGQSFSAEWRWRLRADWLLTAFVDLARVQALPLAAGDEEVRQSLRGRGLSLSWQGPQGVNARLTWARRNGVNPQPTSTGTDGDGTLRRDRFWLNTSWSF